MGGAKETHGKEEEKKHEVRAYILLCDIEWLSFFIHYCVSGRGPTTIVRSSLSSRVRPRSSISIVPVITRESPVTNPVDVSPQGTSVRNSVTVAPTVRIGSLVVAVGVAHVTLSTVLVSWP